MIPLDSSLQTNYSYEYLSIIKRIIDETRDELNLLAINIENKDSYDELLKKSQFLDKLINQYLKEKYKKNIAKQSF